MYIRLQLYSAVSRPHTVK